MPVSQDRKKGVILENPVKEQKNWRIPLQQAMPEKRRGTQNLDLKGTTASRKLASLGRLSPKVKAMKPAREVPIEVRKVPRHEKTSV
ncbi:unnamed protein product [Eruca vesicaria subsp. sativa]|uniref:Uncharacterized protein n=1 Tax=Eruca vesicaria subsp. sativa TaxID=29727 RepID=A0ABC8K803_ERUVS|nr:unnamed protein product [Eruca vesicaria subsp. sativa]